MLRPRPHPVRLSGGMRTLESALSRRGLGPVAGVDEAGRGACAGPLVVAAVVLPQTSGFTDLNDSKVLSPSHRNQLYEQLRRSRAHISVVTIPPADIDRLGVGECNLAGMRRAVATLPVTPGYALTDGFAVRGMPVSSLGVIKGDATAACVAAASIIAKVERDRLMEALASRYPQYGFADHKGYGTASHQQILAERGPTPEHRRSYANVAEAVGDGLPKPVTSQ
ncbi:ribonuclease HII [Natronoglycomyces albus]|uniref:Ribonuclease HII n=1 Tax=Natronoglycomyces albus TaxID=2811108 RepID=A0A895XKE2_9ACTN|nr:ribonuclease HII [Natronoglycomyces albus]QSB06211.1 ribonuclease HII [Natronoglycomyces albus]